MVEGMKLKNYEFSEETEKMLLDLKTYYGFGSEVETLRYLIRQLHCVNFGTGGEFGVMKNLK